MRFFLCSLVLWWGLGISPMALAENGCSGPVYLEPTCNNKCTQDKCHDVSFNQDGTLFQCCPPVAVPELPGWVNPFYLALLISGGFLAWDSRRRPVVNRQRS